ncbi:UDP-N-acetylmuramoyl-L-alanine--D-glutamate ligase [Bartonella sp. HY329]|uniref:UDP-N-acetylmuramoyl-L-alanine--D-glutamate ligase n=1 Tax=unclassified Bartonella TaxID=2645622 RepID=UPI0021C709AE|nr:MULTISPECIES: UDP-N-acetylmuramoyl-L-alanine--D-glutamate ligase [unclassified Bartonella]UXM95880.1 UDP-N-acetylmuramoyl-L-alanine--D-glutamate ligase [Bartonella sp. HY329]UXN10205.1 UDP-N-acetylmuramoyl-L-alanine--D-glutamate ligase [Bartonella sp. HY328]
MIAISSFKGEKVALFGLGGSGIATAKALIAGGSKVIAFDDNVESVERAKQEGITTGDLHFIDWSEIKALILAPGVPLTHPHPHWSAQMARANNIEIIGDIELFVRERNAFLLRNHFSSQDCPFIAITGTNGKSTTTALIAHLLQETGYDVQMGGNIGTAILSLEPFAKKRCYVIECSSYQIDLTPSINPTIGILLNLTPDHIDRHGSFEHYATVKERLIKGADIAVVSIDDIFCEKIAIRVLEQQHKLVPFSTKRTIHTGWFAESDKIFKAGRKELHEIASLSGIASLRGAHNAQNALAALATCVSIGVTEKKLTTALATFKGLAHRMEEVGRKDHVIFINDSKATNAEATAPALSTFDNIYWIAGGVAKEGGISSLKEFFPKIRKAYLIGEAAENFAQTIGSDIDVVISETLEKALQQAARDAALAQADLAAESGADAIAAVLLSPACASFDQFANYGARGDDFRDLVQKTILL